MNVARHEGSRLKIEGNPLKSKAVVNLAQYAYHPENVLQQSTQCMGFSLAEAQALVQAKI